MITLFHHILTQTEDNVPPHMDELGNYNKLQQCKSEQKADNRAQTDFRFTGAKEAEDNSRVTEPQVSRLS